MHIVNILCCTFSYLNYAPLLKVMFKEFLSAHYIACITILTRVIFYLKIKSRLNLVISTGTTRVDSLLHVENVFNKNCCLDRSRFKENLFLSLHGALVLFRSKKWFVAVQADKFKKSN